MAAIALGGAALAACVSPTDAASESAGRECFRHEEVNGFSLVDNNHVRLTVGPNRSYILRTLFNARDLDWTQTIAIRSATGYICTGSAPGVELIGGEPRRTFPVASVERAPEEAPPEQGS
jgi:hypothetical protein